MMIFALGMLLKFIKEPKIAQVAEQTRISIRASIKEIWSAEDKSTLYILFAIFFWFVGYQGVEATFSNYCVQFLGLEVSDASLTLGFFALSFLTFSIPAGFIGSKLGKRKTILIGLVGDAIVFIMIAMIGTIFPFNQAVMMGFMFVGGFFWALININSYPMVVEKISEEKIGTFTGLYYFSSSLAAITGPLLLGGLIDLTSFVATFIFTAFAYLIAFIFVSRTQ
jgi:MFS family permease